MYYDPYLVIRKDDKNGEADEGEDKGVGKGDGQDDARPNIQEEETAKVEQAGTNFSEKKKAQQHHHHKTETCVYHFCEFGSAETKMTVSKKNPKL